LPTEWVPGTLRLRLQVYPSVLADLQQALDGLLQKPSSGFEQTLRSNYPSLLILNYLKTHDRADPALLARARTLLDRGYRQLLGLECRDAANARRGGFEWFGGTSPPSDTLTAYGLLQLRELAQVYPVDPAFVARTHQYLLDRRDGQGGFKRHPQAKEALGPLPAALADAFIIWAITESERGRAAEQRSDLSPEIRQLLKRSRGRAKTRTCWRWRPTRCSTCNRSKRPRRLLQRLQHLATTRRLPRRHRAAPQRPARRTPAHRDDRVGRAGLAAGAAG
jgi:hypothetical protein